MAASSKSGTSASKAMTATPKSLGQRYSSLQTEIKNTKALQELKQMTLEEMGELTIQFGTKVVGRTYLDVVQHETSWTKWFVEHMMASPKPEHQSFILFVTRYTEQGEATEKALRSQGTNPEDPDPEMWDMIVESSEAQAQVVQVTQQMTEMQARMDRLEGMIDQLIKVVTANK